MLGIGGEPGKFAAKAADNAPDLEYSPIMTRRPQLLIGFLGLAVIGFFAMNRFRDSTPRAVEVAHAAAVNTRTVSSRRAAAPEGALPSRQEESEDLEEIAPPPPHEVRPAGPVRIRVGQAIPEIIPHQSERDAVQALVTTYDPAHIPEIARYLGDPDPSVREAARLGLLQMGHGDAIPFLKDALKNATAEEAEQLRADIEFLSLPSATIK
jgi:HEAT repeat protein